MRLIKGFHLELDAILQRLKVGDRLVHALRLENLARVWILLRLPHKIHEESGLLLDAVSSQLLIRGVDEPVAEDALALVRPKGDEHSLRLEHLGNRAHKHALKNSGEVAQAVAVMEFGWSWQQLDLERLAKVDRHVNEPLGSRDDVGRRAGVRIESLPVAWPLDTVHPTALHQLPQKLERLLVAPGVATGHREVVDEDEHSLAVDRAVGLAHPLLEDSLKLALERERCGARREAHPPSQRRVGVLRGERLQQARGLRGGGAAHEKQRALFSQVEVDEVLAAYGVDGWNEERGEGDGHAVSWWWLPKGNAGAPVHPLARRLIDAELEDAIRSLR
eukprot:scaffold1202_cov110-Isochrysis_galbana.AAC.7